MVWSQALDRGIFVLFSSPSLSTLDHLSFPLTNDTREEDTRIWVKNTRKEGLMEDREGMAIFMQCILSTGQQRALRDLNKECRVAASEI